MGLNLSIRRIIFNSMFKNNGEEVVRVRAVYSLCSLAAFILSLSIFAIVDDVKLDHSSVKQIAGRAGRRNSPYPHGEVTCRDPNDMKWLRKCMGTEIEPIKKAS